MRSLSFPRFFCVVSLLLAGPATLPARQSPAENAPGDRSGTVKQRIARVRQLGKRDTAALADLAPYLRDSDRNVRLEAVKAVVQIDTRSSLDPLVEAMRDSEPEVRIRATDGIVNTYLPGYVTRNSLSGYFTRGVRQMKSFFASRNDQVVDADVAIRPDAAQALAVEIANQSSLDARSNAALAAGILRDRAAIPALTEALHTQHNDLIFECMIALQKIGDPAAGPQVGFLARDLDDRIQSTALETVGVLHSLESAPDVRFALKTPRNTKIRRNALQALAMLGIPGDRAVFQQEASSSDLDLRASALEGLGRIREPEDFPVLKGAYDEAGADWRVHLAAAFAMVSHGKWDGEQFSPLPYLVESLNTKGRADIATAYLKELARRDEIRAALVKLVPDATRDQKIALCSIFAESGNDDIRPTLVNLSKDRDPDVAFAGSRGLRILRAHKAS
jgi:HEAT repeat protein